MSQQIQIERMAYGPDGIGKLESGKTVFVSGTVPGDTVEVELVEEKASFARAKLVSVVEPSPDRVPLFSPIDALAGTADWQQIDYDVQLRLKRDNIVDSLVRKGGFSITRAEELVAPTEPCKRQWGYRNKLELSCEPDAQGRFTVGFKREGTAEFVPVDSSALPHKAIAKLPKALQGAIRYAQGSQDLKIHRIGVRHSLATGDLEIALWTLPGPFPRGHFATTLASACKATGIVRVLADPGSARKVKGVEVLDGRGYWRERMGDLTFSTQAPSFFQVNTAQAERLVKTVIEGLGDVNGAFVADLYAGGGTFSIPLAAKGADVIAVEAAASSIRDLRFNANANDVFVDAVGGDAAREIAALDSLDALVVDPPRAGLASGMADAIAQAHPETLVYVSCDPATWLRDVDLLGHAGFELVRAVPVDMFPQTYHVEIVSFFKTR